MMAETDSITYGNEETRWVGCLRFEDLRRRGKLLDLKIVVSRSDARTVYRMPSFLKTDSLFADT